MKTLFERLGGEQAVLLAVSVFYDKVTNDPQVGHYFNKLDMDKQARKQVAFMSMAFDGPVTKDVRELKEAHAGLGITDEEFDLTIQHLGDTLTEIGVEESLKKEVLAIALKARNDVVNIPASAGDKSDAQ